MFNSKHVNLIFQQICKHRYLGIVYIDIHIICFINIWVKKKNFKPTMLDFASVVLKIKCL